MDDVCNYIKAASENLDGGCEYIEFDYLENQDETSEETAAYIRQKLIANLGSDVSDIEFDLSEFKIESKFQYKCRMVKLWETYNSRCEHYWVISV
jgi:hypothetical protein